MSDHGKIIYLYIFLDEVIVKGLILQMWTQMLIKWKGTINRIAK